MRLRNGAYFPSCVKVIAPSFQKVYLAGGSLGVVVGWQMVPSPPA